MVLRRRKGGLFLLQWVRQELALNGRHHDNQARQVLGEDQSRQPMIGAAVHDPKRHFVTANYCIAKGSFAASDIV